MRQLRTTVSEKIGDFLSLKKVIIFRCLVRFL